MRYAVSLRDSKISSSLRKDNVRGESRWERQVAEALIQGNNLVFCRAGGVWLPKQTMPDNFKFGIDASTSTQTVAITHDFIDGLMVPNFKACLFNIYNTHQLRDGGPLIEAYRKHYKDRIMFTHGYYQDQAQVNDLISVGVRPEEIRFLGAPSATQVYEQDNFNKKILLWTSRGIHLHTFPGKENPYLDKYVSWIKEKLETDSELQFVMITGLDQADMDWQGWGCTVEERIFQSPIMEKLQSVKHQIKVLTSLGWDQVLEIMANTKLCVSLDLSRFGGPPIECGMYGIPYVSPVGPTAFMSVPGYLHTANVDEMLGMYSMLFSDHKLYREYGDAGREHVRKYHTYEAFRIRLAEILAEKGVS